MYIFLLFPRACDQEGPQDLGNLVYRMMVRVISWVIHFIGISEGVNWYRRKTKLSLKWRSYSLIVIDFRKLYKPDECSSANNFLGHMLAACHKPVTVYIYVFTLSWCLLLRLPRSALELISAKREIETQKSSYIEWTFIIWMEFICTELPCEFFHR